MLTVWHRIWARGALAVEEEEGLGECMIPFPILIASQGKQGRDVRFFGCEGSPQTAHRLDHIYRYQ